MIRMLIPATSANIGPGFDSLGLALRLHNRVWMREADGPDIAAVDGSDIPCDENNLVYKSARMLYDLCGRPFRGLYLRQENRIPMTRGLGSSSACIVAGLAGANRLLGGPLSTDDLVNLAAHLEGHPDNSTPALLGGFVTAVLDGDRVWWCKVPISGRIRFAAFIPDFELKTEVARRALPMEVPHRDAVFNLSRAALMTASLFSGKLENLAAAVGDRLHQPYRMAFIPGAQQVFDLCASLGALGTFVSGAGPTIMSMVSITDLGFAAKATEALGALPGWRLVMLEPDEDGTTVEACDEKECGE